MVAIAVDRNGPKAFILVPDGEFCSFNPENEQIWALNLDPSDISPFHLHTTYHLRAKSMRIFPNIIINHQRLTKSTDLTVPPTVTSYTPGTLQITYGFMQHVNIQFTCYIPQVDALVGTIQIDNASDELIDLDCELAAILVPMGKGSATHPEKISGNQILSGHTDDLFPVLFMSGSPVGTSNPYPALCASLHIKPGENGSLHWALVSQDSQKASLETARELASPTWHRPYQIQIKTHAKRMMHIQTGDPDWDAAFYLAQTNALTHLVNPIPDQNLPTFIRTRLPDQPLRSQNGSSTIGDLSLLDVFHLSQVILPSHVDHLAALVNNFISRVGERGGLSSRIHRGFTGGSIKECPLLANLCLELFEIQQDHAFLRQVFPALRRFFDIGWLADTGPEPDHLPNWQSPAQMQLETGLFNFDIWEKTGNGLDIRTAESPALAAMLYREALALQKMAQILGDRTARSYYGKLVKKLNDLMLTLWDEDEKFFTYRDRQSHLSPTRELYYPSRIESDLRINKRFLQPQRVQIHLTTSDERTRACVVHIKGLNTSGEELVERHRPPELRWVQGHAHLTTQNLFTLIESVKFEGFSPDDRCIIQTADYSQIDISCMLPLWSGGVPNDQLGAMIEHYLNREVSGFDFGIPETWRCRHPLPAELDDQVNIQWNTLIVAGLVREKFTQEAVTVFSNMMAAIIHGLKDYNGFYPAYNTQDGLPKGQANAISGLAPMGLCLKIAGIKLISPEQVAIWGDNPFPWPIEIRWQGLWVRREAAHTHIIFPDGTEYQSQTTKPVLVKSAKG